jgi:hypothetical protein
VNKRSAGAGVVSGQTKESKVVAGRHCWQRLAPTTTVISLHPISCERNRFVRSYCGRHVRWSCTIASISLPIIVAIGRRVLRGTTQYHAGVFPGTSNGVLMCKQRGGCEHS